MRAMPFKLAAGTIVYAMAFHYAYVFYINPQFEYAGYPYFPRSAWEVVATYALVLAPLVACKASAAPAAYGMALVYALSYVPGQLVLLLGWQRSAAELLSVQACLAASMVVLFIAARSGFRRGEPIYSGNRLSVMVQSMTFLCIAILVLLYRDSMRMVAFADVYSLRSEAAMIDVPVLVAYLLSWLSYCFLPFLAARAIVRRSLSSLLWVLLGSVLVYAATGAKSSVLLPFVVIAVNIIFDRSGGLAFMMRLLWSIAGVIGIVVLLLPDDGVWIWAKSLLLLRILGTGGWVLLTYYEYFSENGYTLYTHIGPIGAITGAYPYGDLSLGQLIGLKYSGSSEANFNANFWASDGFAAFGLVGIPIVTMALYGLCYLINRASQGYPVRFVVLWMIGFWFALLNLPLTTALLSGGGLVTLLLLWSARLRWKGLGQSILGRDERILRASGG